MSIRFASRMNRSREAIQLPPTDQNGENLSRYFLLWKFEASVRKLTVSE